MIFGDDDLKRLKARGTYQRGDGTGCWIRADQLSALLARLEASESCVEAHIKTCGKLECPTEYAWRKAAGKV
jgi:hypothetical protein